MTVTLDGIYDMHVHSALDIIPRKCSDLDLAEQGVQANAAGIVLKYHQGDTTPRAYLCNEYVQKKYPNSHFKMYGSLTMNLPIGGFNIHAVDVAIQNNASVIWMPTIDAENDRKKQHKTGGLTIFDENAMHWLSAAKKLRASGMSIKEVDYYFQLCLKGEETFDERYKILQALRNKVQKELEETQVRLLCIEDKLQHCINIKENKSVDDCNPLNW